MLCPRTSSPKTPLTTIQKPPKQISEYRKKQKQLAHALQATPQTPTTNKITKPMSLWLVVDIWDNSFI